MFDIACLWKITKIYPHLIVYVLLILLAAGVRVLLAALGWPPTNSDEGTMAIMAMNIAAHRDYPLIFYGQDYMGTMEAYLGAGVFWLTGGPSIFGLRLGVVLLITLFLICLSLLARLLAGGRLAMLTLLMLGFGSRATLLRHIVASGGTAETLLFGTLAFLLAAWLALTMAGRSKDAPRWHNGRRLLIYGLWGLAVGLGFWSDMIVLPFLSMAALLLIVFCWRELLPWRWLLVLGSMGIGMLPQVIYDWQHHLNPWRVLLGLASGSHARAPHDLPGILHNLLATVQISLPTATGQPFCPVMEVPAWGPTTPATLPCVLIGLGWGSGYLLLLGAALVLAMKTLYQMRFHAQDIAFGRVRNSDSDRATEQYRALVCAMAHFLLLGAAVLGLIVYTLSSGPVDQPGFHARYLATLLIVTPAVLYPLWRRAERWEQRSSHERSKMYRARVVLVLIWLMLFGGTIITMLSVPEARAITQQRRQLLADLERIGIVHFYTDYWTCYNLIVASNEQVVCAVLDPPNLAPVHNRAPRYYRIVQADPYAALVFPHASAQLSMSECQFVEAMPGAYHRYTSGEYVIYRPLEPQVDLQQAIGPAGVQKWRPGCGPVAATSGK